MAQYDDPTLQRIADVHHISRDFIPVLDHILAIDRHIEGLDKNWRSASKLSDYYHQMYDRLIEFQDEY